MTQNNHFENSHPEHFENSHSEDGQAMTSPILPEDVRLTAYALGEMPEDEHVAFEALLANDPAAQAEVDALRGLGTDLTSLFAAEAVPALSDEQRAAVHAASVARPKSSLSIVVIRACAAVFLCALGIVVATTLVGGGMGGSRRVLRSAPTAVSELTTREGRPYENSGVSLDNGRLPLRPEPGLRGPKSGIQEVYGSPVIPIPGAPNVDPSVVHTGSGPGARLDAVRDDTISIDGNVYRILPGDTIAGVAGNHKVEYDQRLFDEAKKRGEVISGAVVHGELDEFIVRNGVVYRGLPALGRVAPAQPPSDLPPSESYQPLVDNEFQDTKDNHTSTFSIDVDTASYANVRRFLLKQNRLPPADAVRIEEMINAFDYGYAMPSADAEHPIHMLGDVSGCPWNPNHRLARIALQAHDVGDKRPALNLVFLIDVSGSMSSTEKLPLVQRGLSMLLEQMRPGDRIGIVTYASNAGVRLESTDASESAPIQAAIDGLTAGGSTNGAGGIHLAYEMAKKHFVEGAANRVILATDGDFNVGTTDNNELEKLIAEYAAGGVDLSVLGFGMGNLKDERLERLSNRGNGNYAYIDGVEEARKALVTDMLGTLVTVAKDVKFQLFFNPQTVRAWRLIGYANRKLAAADFNNDKKDAGEVGSGHSVTALYEIVPVSAPKPRKKVDPNPYVNSSEETVEAPAPTSKASDAAFTLRLRYKRPGNDTSVLIEREVKDAGTSFDKSDTDFQWATAVAGFGMMLRKSHGVDGLSMAAIEEIATAAVGDDVERKRFLALLHRARSLMNK